MGCNAVVWIKEIPYPQYALFAQTLRYNPEIETSDVCSITYCCSKHALRDEHFEWINLRHGVFIYFKNADRLIK